MIPMPVLALLVTGLLSQAPQVAKVAQTPTATRTDVDPFPAPRAALTIAAATADGGPTMLDLLSDFTELTGHNLSIDEATRVAAAQRPVGLLSSVVVPADQVYSFVESILLERGYVLAVLRAEAPRLLAVYDRPPGHALSLWDVPAGELDRYRDHPALMITTVMHLWPLDARQLGNSLRALTTDGTSIVPVGNTASVILSGPGRRVAEIARILESCAAADREVMVRQAALDQERRGRERDEDQAQGQEGERKPETGEKPRNPR